MMQLNRSQKIGLVGGGIFSFSLLFGYFGFNEVLKFGIKDQTALRKRNEIRGIYLKLPFPLDFRIYFFNVTNPMNVMSGDKPILTEIGPYCYNLWKEKVDIVDNNIEDSLTYTQYDVYEFNQGKSGKLKDDDYVTILHPIVAGIIYQVSRDSPALLNIVNKAIASIFGSSESLYLTAKVKDILFDGVPINCNVQDFSSKAVCTQLKQQLPGIKSTPQKNVYTFSILGIRNATMQKRFKILKGIKSYKDLGRLVELDGEKKLNIWSTEICNRFKGTDGWIFPPMLPVEEGIWSFSTDLCRSIQAYYVEDSVYKGVKVRRYHADLGDMDHNAEDKCYCPSPKKCLKKGVFDLQRCMGAPIYVTLPHFLFTDDMYIKQVDGLHPNVDKHIIKINFEPMTGTPIEARKRVQFNIFTQPSEKIPMTKNIRKLLHPLFWVEEGVELDGPLLKKVQNIFLLVDVMGGLKYVGMLAGFCVSGFGVYKFMKNRKQLNITPVRQVTPNSNGNNENEETDVEDNADKSNNNNNSSREMIFESSNNNKVHHIMSGQEFNKY